MVPGIMTSLEQLGRNVVAERLYRRKLSERNRKVLNLTKHYELSDCDLGVEIRKILDNFVLHPSQEEIEAEIKKLR